MKQAVLVGILLALAGCSLTEPFAKREELPPKVKAPPPPPPPPVTAEPIDEKNAPEKVRALQEEIEREMSK